MDPNELPGQTPPVHHGDPCPLCGTRPAWTAQQHAADVMKDFSEQHRCTPRVQTRARS